MIAVVVGIFRLVLRGEHEIPFGPFLCLGAAVTVLYWRPIWDLLGEHYFSLHAWLLAVLVGCLSLMLVLLPPIRWVTDRFRGGEQQAGSIEQGAGSGESEVK